MTGIAAVDCDFLHALFGSFPYVVALVLLLTLILLARAFRSIVLAIKAVVLNVLSLAAAFGIVVFVFRQGHGSSLWGIEATQSITAYIPVMIFAFLYGLSMDYEVFMLSRMREAYDETGSTDKAIELGLARTGKLVTSGALILMFAFLVLSTSPGYEVKPLAIGVAAGIIFDAAVIRALLVPALMKLFDDANWWMPVDAQLDEDRAAPPGPTTRTAHRDRQRLARKTSGGPVDGPAHAGARPEPAVAPYCRAKDSRTATAVLAVAAAAPMARVRPAGRSRQPFAYSSAERDSNSNPTNGSSPTTHASWPGSMT